MAKKNHVGCGSTDVDKENEDELTIQTPPYSTIDGRNIPSPRVGL